LSDVDKKDLIQNPLNFNVTVTYKEIEQTYMITVKFSEEVGEEEGTGEGV
jgi:hypothetical protein